MQQHNGWVILLALLLVILITEQFVSAELSSIGKIAAFPDKDKEALISTQAELPSFQPDILDKLSYDEEQNLIKNYVSTPPVPEYAMAEILFSKTWFMKNDEDPRPDLVQLTFPAKWLVTPSVNKDEAVVMLRIPQEMLELDDTNNDSEMITILYPVDMFERFSNLSEKNLSLQVRQKNSKIEPAKRYKKTSPILRINQTLVGLNAIDRQVRAYYQRNISNSVSRVTGVMDPFSYNNSGGESFRNYNEREMYLNRPGDAVEFIIDFTDSGQAFAWVAVFDEGAWVTEWNWLNIDVTNSFQQVKYQLTIFNGVYNLFIYDTSSASWYSNSYDDTDNPSTRVDWLVGSTEVDTVGGGYEIL